MLPFQNLEIYDLPDFDVYVTKIGQGQTVPMLVTIPQGFFIPGTSHGVNTYRANCVLRGRLEFREAEVVPFSRVRGESPQSSRIAIAGDYWVTGKDEENAFACIIAKNPLSKFYDYSVHIVESGNELTISDSDMERNVFLLEGELMLGTSTYSGFKHLRLSQPKDYVFRNESENDAFVIFVHEIGIDGARALVNLHYPDNTNDFAFMGDQ